MELSENIKRLRIENGWSQDELAKKAGYAGRSIISRIESGEIDLPYSKIIAFSEVFGVHPVELMGLEDKEDLSDTVTKLFDQLPQDKQKVVLDLLQKLQ